ncbi:hypothetical protein M9Y10_029699 [Tritrichomonas musculus]|uniref:Ubiquitinyl hydrolase 1 n=1 Tax=Tritrichomonas musculus TaxID=1915356 RepID=A0ABR2KMU9_9EUKA
MFLQKRLNPPRIANHSNVCAVNCIIQILFNDDDCWKIFNQLNDSEPLKQIAARFVTVTNRNRSLELEDLYKSLHPLVEAREEEQIMHPSEKIDNIRMVHNAT